MHYLLCVLKLWWFFFLCHPSSSSSNEQTSLQLKIKNYKEVDVILHGIDGLLNVISDPHINFEHTQSVAERLRKYKTWTIRNSSSVVIMPRVLQLAQPEIIYILFDNAPNQVDGTLQLLLSSASYNVSYLEMPRDTEGQLKSSYFKLVDSSNLEQFMKVKIKLLMTSEYHFDDILDLVTEGQLNENLIQYAASKLKGASLNMKRPANMSSLRSVVSLAKPEIILLGNTSLFDPETFERTIQILQQSNVPLRLEEIDQIIYFYQTNQSNKNFIVPLLKSIDKWQVWSSRSVSSLPTLLNLVLPKMLELIFNDTPSKVPGILDTISEAANFNVPIELFKMDRKAIVSLINESNFDNMHKIRMNIAISSIHSSIDDILDLVSEGEMSNEIVQAAVAKLSVLEYNRKITWVLNKSKKLDALRTLILSYKPTSIRFEFEDDPGNITNIIELLLTAGQLNINILIKEYLKSKYMELVEISQLDETEKQLIKNMLINYK